MQVVTTVGLDIAKSVFQVHGVDAAGQVVIRRQLKRRYVVAFFQKLPPCLVGIEACASSHHWSRELRALHGTRHRPWLTALLARRPSKVAVIALANKIARMARGERYREPVALAA
jgi:transposase